MSSTHLPAPLSLLWAAAAQAVPQNQEFFTSFEDVNPNTAVGEIIEVGDPPETAELSGDAFGSRVDRDFDAHVFGLTLQLRR